MDIKPELKGLNHEILFLEKNDLFFKKLIDGKSDGIFQIPKSGLKLLLRTRNVLKIR